MPAPGGCDDESRALRGWRNIGRMMFALLLFLVSAAPQGATAGAQSLGGVTVPGVVQDQTGAILPGADVQLVSAAGVVFDRTATDGAGGFRFEHVPAGSYELRAVAEGFATTSTRVRLGTRAPSSQRLVLHLAGLAQEITVSNALAEVSANAARNVDAVSIDQNMLESLPVFDHDYIATISRFLDTGSLGNGGVTVVVNGMEVNGLNVSASAVSQIRINQDPYSAEYSRPGRGRIEILTKPGSQEYHGETNVIARDARFNSRNAFATTKPPEQRRIFEGFLGGPLGTSGNTSFMVSANDERDANQAFIYAVTPSGIVQDTLPQVSGRALLTASITRRMSDATTFSIRPNYQYESDENRGAGGTTLASAATTFKHHEQQVTYSQQTVVRPTLVNQFQMLLGHEREPTTSRTPDRGIVVAGAFAGGGGQSDLVRTETHINMNENLTWIHGAHLVQTGFQLPDWSRRGFNDRTNFGGTFFFAGLDAYAGGKPYSFTQQRGNGDVALLEKQVGAYLKDDWQVRPGFSIGYGVRYDWQNYFHDNNNVAPRFSVAFAPRDTKANVFRVGLGMFNDRSGPVVIADVLHSLPGGLTRYVITNPGYPDPFGSSATVAQPPSIVRLAPDVQIPQTLQYSGGVDHQLQKNTTLSVTFTGARGYHLFRSRDVNAPSPPLYLERPNPAYGAIRQVESNGREHSDSLAVTLRGRVTRWFNGQMQYTLSRARNDTNGIASFPANDYALSDEWARADFDRRHRFLLLGRLSLVKAVDVGIGLTLNSGAPYTETIGPDIYNNGRGRARSVGIGRNTLEGGGLATLDLRASRDVKFGVGKDARTITLGLDAFNLLNRVNYGSYVGTVGSPFFRLPISARSPRQLQLSGRLKF
jgi:hypothetical protein